jgi:hypothetical protein
MHRRTTVTALLAGTVAVPLLGAAPPSGSTSSATPRPSLYTVTPGYGNPRDAVGADVLLDRIVFEDGVTVQSTQFIYPGEVESVVYNGPVDKFRTMNGPLATVGSPGVRYIEDMDGNGASVSTQDRELFAAQMESTWANNNLNNRIHLHAQSVYSFIVDLETTVWDSDFALDLRPEIFIFEDQGNSVLTIQPLDEDGANIGTAVEVRAVDIRSITPNKVWVGRFAENGALQSGTYELKVFSVDLTRLGVAHVRRLKITTAIGNGGEASADLKIIAVDTSPAPAAQTMTFD